MKLGIAYLSESRKDDGLVGDLSVRDNIILAQQVLRGFFRPYSKSEAYKIADEYIKLLEIKTASADTRSNHFPVVISRNVSLRGGLLTHPII